MAKWKAEIETIDLPDEFANLADRRTDPIVRRTVWDHNIIQSIARSCYLQGVQDGVQVVEQRPTLLAELRAIQEGQ